jgi:HSP20 family molecular chaperone IbpA
MFRELTRLIEAASELAGHVTAASGPAVVDVHTRVAGLGRDATPGTVARDVREPIVDVFNEDACYVVVAELRGVEQSSVQWHVEQDRLLVIRAESGRRKYYKEIQLGAPVDSRSAGASYGNGILELRLWKR